VLNSNYPHAIEASKDRTRTPEKSYTRENQATVRAGTMVMYILGPGSRHGILEH
jgi:hypothetical protein